VGVTVGKGVGVTVALGVGMGVGVRVGAGVEVGGRVGVGRGVEVGVGDGPVGVATGNCSRERGAAEVAAGGASPAEAGVAVGATAS